MGRLRPPMLPEIDFARLDRFEKATGICTETLIAYALDAALNFYEANGSLALPLTVANCGSCRFLAEHYQRSPLPSAAGNIIPFPA